MYRVIAISHGDLAKAMLESAQMIIGPQESNQVRVFGLYEGDSPETLRKAVESTLEEWHQEEILVLTDIRSGTPFNTAVTLMQQYSFRHICGMNLAILLEALLSRDFKTVEESAKELMSLAGETILDVNHLLDESIE